MMRSVLSFARRCSVALLPAGLVLAAAPAEAAPGGLLRVLLKGYWVCETGGDAVTPPVPMPQDSFRVLADSSYRNASGETGTYLLLGNELTMTGGPFRGRRYVLVGQGIVHPVDAAGQRGAGRCVRQSAASTASTESTTDDADTGQN